MGRGGRGPLLPRGQAAFLVLGVGRLQGCLRVPEIHSKCRRKETRKSHLALFSPTVTHRPLTLAVTGGRFRPVWFNLLAVILSSVSRVPVAPVSLVAK